MEQYCKEKKESEEQNKQLAKKLTQLQVEEITIQKKERDKGKVQAPVIRAAPKALAVEDVAEVTQVAPVPTPAATPSIPLIFIMYQWEDYLKV